MGVQNIMKIEFDPAKDEANIAKHGLSLQAAERFDYGEVRFVALGMIGDRLHVLVFTEGSHDDAIRAISLRPAEKHEARFYYGQV